MKTINSESKSARKPHLGTVLVLLLIVTFLFTGVSFSKYATTVKGDSHSKVAVFDITSAGTFYSAFEWKPNQIRPVMQVMPQTDTEEVPSYTIVLTNKSEVDLEYTVTVEQLANNIPLQISIRDAQGQVVASSLTTEGEADENVAVATGSFYALRANNAKEERVTYTVDVAWDDSKIDAAYSYEVDAIRVTVTAVQVNPEVEEEPTDAQQ